MQRFHVVLTDELGDEFSVTIEAEDREDAWETVAMDYPESSVVTVYGETYYRREARNRLFNSLWED